MTFIQQLASVLVVLADEWTDAFATSSEATFVTMTDTLPALATLLLLGWLLQFVVGVVVAFLRTIARVAMMALRSIWQPIKRKAFRVPTVESASPWRPPQTSHKWGRQ